VTEPCPGVGRCHGCARWCDDCGDVDTVCNSPSCMAHHCVRCEAKLTDQDLEIDDQYPVWCTSCLVRERIEQAIARGQDEAAAGERAWRAIENGERP
jgi:hypothetical protein